MVKAKPASGSLVLTAILSAGVSAGIYVSTASSISATVFTSLAVEDASIIETHNVSTLLNHSITTVSEPNEYDVSDEELWKQIDALYGAWETRDDINDDWLDELRGRSSSRLKDIYGEDWE